MTILPKLVLPGRIGHDQSMMWYNIKNEAMMKIFLENNNVTDPCILQCHRKRGMIF